MIAKVVTIALLASLSGAGCVSSGAQAANVPCEEMLKEMRVEKATAKLSDADTAKVNNLKTKAVERCNADDYVSSDKFSAEALKIMGVDFN